jgi:serine protease Do
VTAGSSDTDWFNEEYESERRVSGLVVDDNGVEELILTTYSDISGADQLKVTFGDSSTVEAALKKYDMVTNLAILSVNLGDLQESTRNQIKTVTWGNSRSLRSGEPVIAVGSPTGIAGSMLFGNLTEVSYYASAVDGEYQLLITDMLKGSHSNGVLVNFKGEVIGWLQSKYPHTYNEEALSAYGISDLKGVIEHLCNNQDIVYLGIRGADVTEEVQEELGLPEGVYITGVEMDSPAMTAGIQSGDVIVDISGQEAKSLRQIQELLLNFSEDQVISVKVMRQGKDGLVEIVCSVGLSALK